MQHVKTRTLDAAVGKWDGILKSLGVDEKFLVNKHGPCPICGGIDRFRFDDKDGRGTYFCSHCGAGSGIDMLIKINGWTFAQACKEVDSVLGTVIALPKQKGRTEAEKIAAIKKILSECVTVQRGDPVWTYLYRRTGIESVPSDIKFHRSLYHSAGGAWPAMVAIMRDENGKGVSVHRTYLNASGEKAPVKPAKKFCEGLPLNGASVRLSRVQKHIGIAEGIETALSAGRMFSIPTWAATNATLLDQWRAPVGIEKVSIFADCDSSYTGQWAAFSLAKRLRLKGIEVDVHIPDAIDTDWADQGVARVSQAVCGNSEPLSMVAK
jgi:putative DNA primase/helicase